MPKFTNILDISRPIYKGMITYPGNPTPEIVPMRTKTSYISKITFGSHTGTHVDAPRHVFKNGRGVDQIPLDVFIGPCRVIDLTHVTEMITITNLRGERIKKGERILAKTKNSLRGFRKFYADYVYLDGDAAKFLATCGIALFGIDSLSVKKRGEADNRGHTELLKKGIAILEGLDLLKISAGSYFLAALPLRIKNGDGAPARVVLLK